VNSFSHSPPQSVHTWASYTAVSYLFSPPITVASEETRLQFRHWLAQPPRDFFYFGFGSSRLLLLTENEALQDWPEAGGWFERGGYTNTGWEGSFTNFLHTVARFPTHTMGETVRVVWEFETWTYRYGGGAIRYWLDSVEVLDGYTCCDGITPVLRPMVRQGNNVVLRWSAISNRTYRVEWRAALNSGSWTALAGDVIATGTAASKTNAVSGIQQRFYRVLLLP
jgi:hypothetical protein